jgi:helicase MOV-10
MKKAASRDEEQGPKKCIVCDTALGSARDASSHFNGQKHKANVQKLRQEGRFIRDEDMIVNDDERNYECLVCEIRVWEPKSVHQRSARHKRRERFINIRAALEEAEKDKNGVSIEPSGKDAFDFGLNTSGRASREVKLRLDNSQSRVILRSATLSGDVKKRSWQGYFLSL